MVETSLTRVQGATRADRVIKKADIILAFIGQAIVYKSRVAVAAVSNFESQSTPRQKNRSCTV